MEIAIQNWITKKRSEFAKVDMLSRAGFSYVDWDLRRYSESSPYASESIEACTEYNTRLRRHMDRRGVKVVQTHAMFPTAFADKNDITMLAAIENCFLASNILGAEYIVVHPITPKKWDGEANRELRLNENIKFYNEISALAKKYNVIICIENMFGSLSGSKYKETSCSRYEEMLVIFDALEDKDRFGFCFDSGHANMLYGDKVDEMIRAIGTHIKVVHLHDNNAKSDQHLPPGEGSVEWDTVMHTLHEVGFNGVYNFEISPCLRLWHKHGDLRRLHDYLEEFVAKYE